MKKKAIKLFNHLLEIREQMVIFENVCVKNHKVLETVNQTLT